MLSPSFPARCLIMLLLGSASLAGCQPAAESTTNAEEAATRSAPELIEVWTLDAGLDRPESVIYDARRDVLYITNIVGDAAEMDGNGYIARVSPAGEMIDQSWVSGLNAPKGIAIDGNRLWASDIDALVEIDLESGEILNRFSVEGEAYLNDVAVHPDGYVFVTDSRYSKIYRYAEGQLELWLEDATILMPNGAHVIGDELVVVAGDASTENPGQARYFRAIRLSDKSVRAMASSEPDGALDAVEPDGEGGIFTTGWASGRLTHFREGEGTTLLRQLGQGAADLDYIAATRMLYVPVMQEGRLIAYRVQ